MKTQPIKLLVDAHVFDGEFQGTRTFIKEIYNLLAKRDNLIIYLAAHNIEALKENFPAAPNVIFLQYKSKSSFNRLLVELPRMIRHHNIDYAHFQYIVPPIKRCKYIVTIHDVIFNEYPDEFSWSYRTIKKFLFGQSARRSEIVTTVSEYSRRSIEKFLKVPAQHVQVVPNGVNTKLFAPGDKLAAQALIEKKFGFSKFILYVSRIEKRKNHIALLQAFVELELYAKGYKLVLLGHESIKVPAFDNMLQELPDAVRQSIFISASVDDHDLLNFYRAAAIFVYPSKAEGFGIPPLEAAALGTPVICSNASAMSDFDFFGENHIDTLKNGLLKQRLQLLINHPPDENSLRKLSELVRERYSWTSSATKLYNALFNK